MSSEPYRDRNATGHSIAQVPLTGSSRASKGFPRAGAGGCVGSARNENHLLDPEESPDSQQGGLTAPRRPRAAAGPLSARHAGGQGWVLRDRGRGVLWAPGPSGRGRGPSKGGVSSSAAGWEASSPSGWAPGLTPHPWVPESTVVQCNPPQSHPGRAREGDTHSESVSGPPSFAPHVQ